MRILVLSKRQYTGKDLLDDHYGRLYEIPAALAKQGHQVTGLTLSYRSRTHGLYERPDSPGLRWYSINALPFGLLRYRHQLLETAHACQPDIIWACSDTPHALIGWFLKTKLGRPLVIDLYDNFESFGLNRIPGMTSLLRAACHKADGLSLVSNTLREYVYANYAAAAPSVVIGNGIRDDLFFARDRAVARSRLGLPSNARLIGSAGAIDSSRGIDDLFKAFLRLAKQDENLWLVHAGPKDSMPSKFHHERIIDLGILPQEQIPWLLSALDVAVICNRDSAFGRYCFPQKFYEAIACGTPLVAAAVGDVASLLQHRPECLYPPGDHDGLAARISQLFMQPSQPGLPVLTWQHEARRLEAFFQSICRNASAKSGGLSI